MISERKLSYYEHVAEKTCSAECRKIIAQLIDEVRQLRRETAWLATTLACDHKVDNDDCVNCDTHGPEDCYYCWREEARRKA